MKNLVLTLLCLIIFFKLQSASYTSEIIISDPTFQDDGKKMTIEEKLKKYEGTFQIQVKGARTKPSIPYDIDEIIEKNRKESEVTYVSLGTNVRLKVLPLNDINKGIDKKLPMISTFND